jgi:hypothetical protein
MKRNMTEDNSNQLELKEMIENEMQLHTLYLMIKENSQEKNGWTDEKSLM